MTKRIDAQVRAELERASAEMQLVSQAANQAHSEMTGLHEEFRQRVVRAVSRSTPPSEAELSGIRSEYIQRTLALTATADTSLRQIASGVTLPPEKPSLGEKIDQALLGDGLLSEVADTLTLGLFRKK